MVSPDRVPGNGELSAEKRVELVVPPSAHAHQLFRFMRQLDERLRDNYASITNMVPSWDSGTIITIKLHPDKLLNLPGMLGNMPEVEKLEEEPVARGDSPRLPRKLGALLKSSISPSRRVRVTLKRLTP